MAREPHERGVKKTAVLEHQMRKPRTGFEAFIILAPRTVDLSNLGCGAKLR
jgi:hypothetical protein